MSVEFDDAEFPGVYCGSPAVLDNADPITVCAWIYPTGWGQSSFGRIATKENAAGGWLFFVSNAGGVNGVQTLAFVRNRSTTDTNYRGSDNAVVLNTWQHVAVTYTSTGSKLYVNGVLLSTVTAVAGSGTVSDATAELIIGNNYTSTRSFDGQIEDLRIYERELSVSEIKAIYTSRGRDGIKETMLGRWPLVGERPGFPPIDNLYMRGQDRGLVTSGTSISLTPQNAVDGDLMIAVVAARESFSGPPVITTPSGWTLITSVNTPFLNSVRTCFYRRTASSESGSYSFNIDATCTIIGYMAVYDGNAIETTQDASGTTTGSSSTGQAPSVTTSDNSLVFSVVAAASLGIVSPPIDGFPANGNNLLHDENGTVGDVSMYIASHWKGSGSSGAESFPLYLLSDWGGITVAFNGGPGAGDYKRLRDVSENKNDGKAVNAVMTFGESQIVMRRRV